MYKPPRLLLSKLKRAAPTYSGEHRVRELDGHYAIYESVIIYIQQGLAEYPELIKEVVKLAMQAQTEGGKRYPLLVFAFGNKNELIHEKKYFDFGYFNDVLNTQKVVDALLRITTNVEVNPAIVPQLFPKTDIRSLYYGKVSVSQNDLLIFIGEKNQVLFDEKLQPQLKRSIIKHTLFVEVEESNVNWSFGKFTPIFI